MFDEKTILSKCMFGGDVLEQFFQKYTLQTTTKPRHLPTANTQEDEAEGDFAVESDTEDADDSPQKHTKLPADKNTIFYNASDIKGLLRPNNMAALALVNKGKLGSAVVNSEAVYATHMPHLVQNCTRPLALCFPGGFVFPVTRHTFTKQKDIVLNVLDFRSLYPTMMTRHDICMSNAAYHPEFMIQTPSGLLVHPADQMAVSTYAVPVKVSGHMVNIVCYTLRGVSSTIRRVTLKFNAMRREAKNKISSGTLSAAEHHRYDALQLTYKLVVNSMYGLYNSSRHKTFRPILGALVTYMGRMSLVRLVFESALFFDRNGLDHESRGVIYGDTDSIFLMSTEQEANAIIEQFHQREYNANEVVVEYEKRIEHALFFTKKHYILRTRELRYYTSKVFTLRVSPISNRFLYLLFNIIFDEPINLSARVKFLFSDFVDNDVEVFKKRIKFSKLPSEYTNNTFLLGQYKHAISTGLLPPPTAGTTVQCTHYLFCFSEGPHYGAVEPDSARMRHFLKTQNIRHTILIDPLLPLFPDLQVSKCMLFVRDLKTEICKVFNTIKGHRIYHSLRSSLVEEFSAAFSAGDLIFDTAGSGELLDSETIEDLCSNLIARKRRKLGN